MIMGMCNLQVRNQHAIKYAINVIIWFEYQMSQYVQLV